VAAQSLVKMCNIKFKENIFSKSFLFYFMCTLGLLKNRQFSTCHVTAKAPTNPRCPLASQSGDIYVKGLDA